MKDTSLFKTIMDNITDGVYFVDRERRITLWNQAAESITGHSAHEVMGHRCEGQLLAHTNENGAPLCAGSCPLAFVMQSGQPLAEKASIRHHSGRRIQVSIQVLPVYSNGAIAGAVEIFSKQPETVSQTTFAGTLISPASRQPAPEPTSPQPPQPLRPTAAPALSVSTDTLTGLPDKAYLENRLQHRLQKGGPFCIVMADLDNFAALNASYSKEVADMALESLADSFENGLAEDILAGRWEEDSFLLLAELPEEEPLAALAEQMRELVAQSGVDFPDFFVGLTASVGLAVAQPGDTVESLVQRALQLVQRSKKEGKNRSSIQGPGK